MAEKLYIRDFTVEQIVNEVPSYQKIYVSFGQIEDKLNTDIKKYNELFSCGTKVRSECTQCGERQTFSTFTEKHALKVENIIRPSGFFNSNVSRDQVIATLIKESIQNEIHPQHPIADSLSDYAIRSYEYVIIRYTCSYDKSHTMAIVFKLTDEGSELSIMKIGQYPAISMLQEKNISQYEELLDDDYQELLNALQLHSDGYSVASFVYLRRIYENLIRKEHQNQCSTNKDWNDDKYKKLVHFGDKIKMLIDNGAELLPKNFESKKTEIYKFLSLGVHQYSEQKCNQYFDVLFPCITIILDHIISSKVRVAKINEFSSALDKLSK